MTRPLPTVTFHHGDALTKLAPMADESIHCVVTSFPYFNLRDYGIPSIVWLGVKYAPMTGLPDLELPGDLGCDHEWISFSEQREVRTGWGLSALGEQYRGGGHKQGQIERFTVEHDTCQKCGAWRGCLGSEPTLEMYIGHLICICREIKRVLRRDGVFWLNIGDSYSQEGKWGGGSGHKNYTSLLGGYSRCKRYTGTKPKDLLLIPARLVLALQADGWYVRRDNIWSKLAHMPEPVQDRPTGSHEYVFLLSRSPHYFFDREAVRLISDPKQVDHNHRYARVYETFDHNAPAKTPGKPNSKGIHSRPGPGGRNLGSVWNLGPEPFRDAHFATFVTEIPSRCIKAGTSQKGCCPECGAPWMRVIEKHLVPGPKGVTKLVIDDRDRTADPNDQGSNRQKTGHKSGWRSAHRTIGWYPTCQCARLPKLPRYPHKPKDDTDIPNYEAEVERVRAERLELLCHADPLPVEPCTVLDPCAGAGTTLLVAKRLGRHSIGIEPNEDYIKLAQKRIARDAPEDQEAEPIMDDFTRDILEVAYQHLRIRYPRKQIHSLNLEEAAQSIFCDRRNATLEAWAEKTLQSVPISRLKELVGPVLDLLADFGERWEEPDTGEDGEFEQCAALGLACLRWMYREAKGYTLRLKYTQEELAAWLDERTTPPPTSVQIPLFQLEENAS